MARFIAGKLLPWRRYWVPWNGSVNSGFDGRGFLDDPEDEYGNFMNPSVAPIADLLSLPCLVLGGQPGIGKSTEIDRLQAGSSEWLKPDETLITACCLDIDSTTALLRETVESPAWRQTLGAGGRIRLLMDGVDQALRRVPMLVPALVRRLRQEPLDRVSVIMACRVWDWDTTGDGELFALWPQSGEHRYELCHLRRKDAELAARESGVDPETFFEAVYRIHAQGLAARPITLRMLLEEMCLNGHLPSDHRTVFGRAIRRLSAEWDPESVRYQPAKPPPAGHVERTAARIASLLMLSGKNTIIRGVDTPSAGELPITDIIGGTETIDGCTFSVSQDLVEATLATPLFSSRGKDRFGFDHASYPEYLSASYLSACTLPQVRKLLCARVAGLERVAPQLGEVAANLANIHPAWCDHLIGHEPEVLLRSDASGLDPDRKARFVASLLSHAAKFKAFDDRNTSLFYYSLAHPSLAGQLRPYILGPHHNFLVRRMAIGIAGEANVSELEACLWGRVEANDERLSPIAHALGRLAGPASPERLLRAIRGELPDNEGGDLKGMAIQKLVPSIMAVRDILPHIRMRPSRSFIGGYCVALESHLPRAMTAQDVPAIANFIDSETDVFDQRTHLNPLVARAFELGLPNLDDSEIAGSLARLWLKMARGHRPFPHKSSHSGHDLLAALDDPVVRRRLGTIVLGLPGATPDDLLDHRVPLLRDEDLGWLLDELPRVSPADRQCWAKTCAALCWRKARPAHRDLILMRCDEIPELRAELPPSGRYDIVTTMERLQRAGELRWSRRNTRFARQMSRPTRAELLDGVRASLARGENTAWVGFCECAYVEDARDSDETGARLTDHSDIETSPAWLSLAAEERQRFRASARLFLLSHDDRDRPGDRWSNFSAAAYHAIRLLRDDMDADQALCSEVFDRWPMVVFDHLGSGGAAERDQVALGCRRAPESARAWIARDLEHSHRKDDSSIHWSLFAENWTSSLSEVVCEFLCTHPVRCGLFVNAIGFLSQHDGGAALTLVDALLQKRGGKFEPLDESGRGLVAIALFRFPRQFLPRLWHLLEKASADELRAIFFAGIEWLRMWGAMNRDEMSDKDLGRVVLMVWRIFPRSKYSDRNDTSGLVHTRHEIPDFRRGLIAALVSRGTTTACDQLRWLSETAPKEDRWLFKWHLHECQENLLRQTWGGLQRTSRDILKMVRDHRAALVEDEKDLACAVLASLERLQERLHYAEASELRALWNEPRRRGRSPERKSEAVLSDMIKDWLSRDLGRAAGVILNREVAATRAARLDIKVEATRRGQDPITLIIEVKGSWNREVPRAVADQLVERYLILNGWTHGIMLVGWFGSKGASRRGSRWPARTLQAATRAVARCCRQQTPDNLTVHPVVLDCDITNRVLPGRMKKTVVRPRKPPVKKKRTPSATRRPGRSTRPIGRSRPTPRNSRSGHPGPGPKPAQAQRGRPRAARRRR